MCLVVNSCHIHVVIIQLLSHILLRRSSYSCLQTDNLLENVSSVCAGYRLFEWGEVCMLSKYGSNPALDSLEARLDNDPVLKGSGSLPPGVERKFKRKVQGVPQLQTAAFFQTPRERGN